MVVGARQSFQFFRQVTWFLGNNRALSKCRYQILHNLISIIKLQKNQSVNTNFKLTTRAIFIHFLSMFFFLPYFSSWSNWNRSDLVKKMLEMDIFCNLLWQFNKTNQSKVSPYNLSQKQPPGMFYKKAVLTKIPRFTGKNLCWSIFSLSCRPNCLQLY